MKKLMLRVALVALLLTAFAPLVRAQQEAAPLPEVPAPNDPVSTDSAPTDSAPTDSAPSDPISTDPISTTNPTVGSSVGCQVLYQDPKAFCTVDKNGDITLPNGNKAQVFVDPKG